MVILDDNRNHSSTLTCLRLYNVQQEANETAEDCFYKVKEIIKVAALDIPDPVIDRAHRVGVGYNNKPPAMIVKFTTSRHRTKLYRARKEIKERFGYSLQVDLAKENLYTLKKVREIGKENKDVTGFEFAYANINCVLYMKINGRFEKFNTVEDANRLMGLNANEEVSDDSIGESICSSSITSSSSGCSSSGSNSDDPDKGGDGENDSDHPNEKDLNADDNEKNVNVGDNEKGVNADDHEKIVNAGDNEKGVNADDNEKNVNAGDNEKGVNADDNEKYVNAGDNEKGVNADDNEKNVYAGDNEESSVESVEDERQKCKSDDDEQKQDEDEAVDSNEVEDCDKNEDVVDKEEKAEFDCDNEKESE